jgi:hypothetical protein
MRRLEPMLAILLLLASLSIAETATASTIAGADASIASLGLQETLGTHQEFGFAYDDLASDSLLAARGAARAVDPNKLHHIFGRGGHGLDDVVKAAESREAAFGAMEKAAQVAFDAGKLAAEPVPGVFKGIINVGGVDVTVRGAVVDGVFRIGSAWR